MELSHAFMTIIFNGYIYACMYGEDVCRHQTHVCYKKGYTFMVWEASGLGPQSSLARLPLNLLGQERVRPNRLYNSSSDRA